MTKFRLVFSIFALSLFAAVSQGGVYLELRDGRLLCVDSEIITLPATLPGSNNSIRHGRIGIFDETIVGNFLDIQHVWDFETVTPSIDAASYSYIPLAPTIDSSFPPYVIGVSSWGNFPETPYFDAAISKWDMLDLSESLVVTAVPEPASLVLFGIGGFLISRRRNK